MKMDWNKIDSEETCKNCGHNKHHHDDFENSLGDDGHSCTYYKYEGKAKLRCDCKRFKLTDSKKCQKINATCAAMKLQWS